MRIATKAQLDRAVSAAREVERLEALLTSESNDSMSSEEWARNARAFVDAKADLTKARRVLESIEAFNKRAK